MATKMVGLLDYLVSYLYVLPSRISGLEEDLAPKIDPGTQSPAETP